MPEILYGDLKLETSEFHNPRTRTGLEDTAIEELATDIEKRGLLYPLIVWVPHNVILGGQRRYLALGRLCRTGRWEGPVPVRPIEAPTLEDAKAIALADGLQRKNISSFEVAQALARMEGTQKEIADRIGKSPTYVNRLLSTWKKAIPELGAAWGNRRIPFDLVREIAKRPPEKQRAELIKYLRAAKGSRKARGAARRGFGRPGVRRMREIAKKPASSPFEEGAVAAVQYLLSGNPPDDPRWSLFLDSTTAEESTS